MSLPDPAAEAKRAAGEAAAALVDEGMRVGLGTGSTAWWFIEALGRRVAAGLRVTAVPTSEASAAQARGLGIPLTDLGPQGLDLDVDGADLIDDDLRLIKGGGGAHVREKVVAESSSQFVVLADESKLVSPLRGPVPLEILGFGAERTRAAIAEICGVEVVWRMAPDGAARLSDNGNPLADAVLGEIADPEGLGADLDSVPGLVGHGLFLGMADLVIVGLTSGGIREVAPRR